MTYKAEERGRLYDLICEQVSKGVPLRKICERHESLPSLSTVMKWLTEDAAFSEQYTRAREEQADYIADQIVEIADAPVVEHSLPDDEDGSKARVADRLEMERRRQQIEARKWVAAKLKPKVYGDKLDLGGSVAVTLSDEQLDARLAHLLGKTGAVATVGGEGTPEEAA